MENKKSCQNCQQEFIIEQDDTRFYQNIQVPPPTWCPSCRLQRRMLFFNERALYKGKCGLCGKEVISSHRPDVLHPVYCQPCWWSDDWDQMAFGRAYDFSKNFFEQYRELRDAMPLPALNTIYASNISSDYCNMCSYVKNCYLCFSSDYDEECSFSTYLEKSKQTYDVDHAMLCERCYDSVGLFKCYNVRYSNNLGECIDTLFSKDCENCTNCFGCINLRNKQYCIFNEQKTKEQYFEELKKYDLMSSETVQELKKKAQEFFLTQPQRYLHGTTSNVNVTGDYLFWCKNVHESYDMVGAEDCKHCSFFIIEGGKNCMDVTMWGGKLMQGYESCGVGGGENNVMFSYECWNEGSNLTFCSHIVAPNSNLFGCIGLRHKQYCILNKQYTHDEYLAMISKIKDQMSKIPYVDKKGREYRYGEFFPPELSPLGYNESFANKYLPISRETATEKGYRWSEPHVRDYKIGGDIIECEHKGGCSQQCSTAFHLTPNEKEFYRQLAIPTPQLCPNCRHYERIKLRNPIKLYSRTCQKCGRDIETNFVPDRKEIVYCEACYQAEIV